MNEATIVLKSLLAENTMPSAPELVRTLPDGSVQCFACGHRCTVKPGRTGVCRVRFNEDGVLRAPAGYVAGVQVDPIEKKPFFHAYPARNALSFGMLGCDFHCGYCQNWVTSQSLRDDRAAARPHFVGPEQLAIMALAYDTPVMVSTYNEPLITCDWAVEVFKPARERGIVCGFISNGNGTPQALEFIRPYVDLYKIDLKSFNDKHYRELGGALDNVLDTIRRTHQMGFWVEIVTLLIPGFNDSNDEVNEIAEFLVSVSPDLPWHVTAFHPDYKMTDVHRTPAETLARAYDAGRKAGLRYVYAGNMPGALPGREDTCCPSCDETIIRRTGFYVEENRMKDGACPACGTPIPGVWEKDPPRQTDGVGLPQLVQLGS